GGGNLRPSACSLTCTPSPTLPRSHRSRGRERFLAIHPQKVPCHPPAEGSVPSTRRKSVCLMLTAHSPLPLARGTWELINTSACGTCGMLFTTRGTLILPACGRRSGGGRQPEPYTIGPTAINDSSAAPRPSAFCGRFSKTPTSPCRAR